MERKAAQQNDPRDAWSESTRSLIRAAVAEDLGDGDVSAALLADGAESAAFHVVPRQPGVICGLALLPAICDEFARRLDAAVAFEPAGAADRETRDGDIVARGQVVGRLAGQRAALLSAERTLLNFLTRLSGVATLTRRYVEAAAEANPACRVYDTRKTIPAWRALDKYAVRCGCGCNHRMGLFDAVLIKDNHLAGVPLARLAPAIFEMLNTLSQRRGRQPDFVEVEVDSPGQLAEVLKVVGVQVVLLDNFTSEQMRAAVAARDAAGLRGRVALEASGGVSLDRVREIAATGVERIAVGALTHSAPALDIGLDADV